MVIFFRSLLIFPQNYPYRVIIKVASIFARIFFAFNDSIHKCKSHSNLVQNKGQQIVSAMLPDIN
jgi:hypothetical protein